VWGIEQAHFPDKNLVVYPCPTGYCNCILQHNNLGEDVCSFAYFNGDPDKQCVCERKGQYISSLLCNHFFLPKQVTCVVTVEMVKE